MSEDAKQCIERAFKYKVFDLYGQTNRMAAICIFNYRKRHVVDDYSIVELVPVELSGMNRIIGTSFWNRARPLSRFDISGNSTKFSNKLLGSWKRKRSEQDPAKRWSVLA